jgi:hypothetical protein
MAISLGPEDEIRVMLEQVRAAAQNEEKSALLDAMLSMAECGPDICESFFTELSLGPTAHKVPPGNLFELCLDMLSDSSAAIAGQVVQVLLIVSQKVGLGMPALRRMMQQLFNDSGEWSKNARQIILCTAKMAQLEGDAKSRAANGTEPLHFFVLDGVSSGLYLGGDSNWAWSEGYTFAAWVWKDGNEPGDVTLLHLVGGEVEDSVLQLVIRTDKRGGGSAAHLVLLVGHGARLTQVDTQVAIPTSKWTRVALAHEYNKVKTSVVTTWVDDSSSVTALKYPAQQSNVRAYAGCSSYSRHGANHPGAAHAQQARRFKGLLGTVSLWNKALSYSDVAFAHTLDARNSGEARGQDDEGERPRPRYCASPGSVVFPPASQNAGNKEQRSPLLTCNSCAAGALRVGGRAGLIASLETLGHLDVLMWMLRLAVNESSPDAEQCVQARPWSRAPLQRALACDLLGLTESLITHSALVKAMLRSERGGLAKRLVAGVTQALSCYPLHGSHEEMVLALCGLIDCCAQVVLPVASTASRKDHELWAQSLARKGSALHDKMVASWLLNPNVWKARHLKQGNVMSVVTERMVKWAQRDPRRLLGNDDFAALFYRLLVLCNDEEQLKQLGNDGALDPNAHPVEADLALAVCSQLLHPSLAMPQGPDGSLFVRPSLHSLTRLILAAGPTVKLVGLKLLGQTMMTWKEAGHFAALVDMLGDINWPCLLLSIMHDDRAQCEMLGLSLSALAMFLSNAPTGTRASFVDIGGYAAVEAILCRRNLSLEQQRVCFRAVLLWLSPTEDSVRDRNANRADKHDRHIVVLLLRMLEVCDAQVRLEAVRGIKTLLCTSRKAAGAVAAVSGWADLLLRLSLGQGIGSGSPATAQSVSQEIGNGIYDEVIQVLSAVVQHSLLHGRKGWLTLRDALEALSRFRLPEPGDAAHEEGGFGGMGAGVEALERRLTSSARLLLVSYIETLNTLVGSMNTWNADASFRSQSLSGRNPDADMSVKGAAYIRDEAAGLLVVVHIFLLSGFSEEQRSKLLEDRLSGDRVPAPSSSDPNVTLLLVRGLRITSGGLEGPSIGEASWLDKTIVSKALVLLYTLNSLPDSPHTLCVNDLFFQE